MEAAPYGLEAIAGYLLLHRMVLTMRHCCFIPCAQPATHQIDTDGKLYDHVDACLDHLGALLTCAPYHTVSVIDAPCRPSCAAEAGEHEPGCQAEAGNGLTEMMAST